MEGTSGAADRVLLRGGTQEAALFDARENERRRREIDESRRVGKIDMAIRNRVADALRNSSVRASPACDMRCPRKDGLGLSSFCERSQSREAVSLRQDSPLSRSHLGWLLFERRGKPPGSSVAARLHSQAEFTGDRVFGLQGSGNAADVFVDRFRLQKSTGDVRSHASMSEELEDQRVV